MGLLEGFFSALFGGTSKVHTTDIWGNPKTIIYDYSTGTTKEYTRHKAMFGGYYTEVYISGPCSCCNGTGTYEPTGKTCRKCGGSGTYEKHFIK